MDDHDDDDEMTVIMMKDVGHVTCWKAIRRPIEEDGR